MPGPASARMRCPGVPAATVAIPSTARARRLRRWLCRRRHTGFRYRLLDGDALASGACAQISVNVVELCLRAPRGVGCGRKRGPRAACDLEDADLRENKRVVARGFDVACAPACIHDSTYVLQGSNFVALVGGPRFTCRRSRRAIGSRWKAPEAPTSGATTRCLAGATVRYGPPRRAEERRDAPSADGETCSDNLARPQ